MKNFFFKYLCLFVLVPSIAASASNKPDLSLNLASEGAIALIRLPARPTQKWTYTTVLGQNKNENSFTVVLHNNEARPVDLSQYLSDWDESFSFDLAIGRTKTFQITKLPLQWSKNGLHHEIIPANGDKDIYIDLTQVAWTGLPRSPLFNGTASGTLTIHFIYGKRNYVSNAIPVSIVFVPVSDSK